MSGISTLAANMRNAFIERKDAKIGGGVFSPEELRGGAIALKAVPDLLESLKVTLRVIDTFAPDYSDRLFADQARALIAKLEGIAL